MDFRFKCIHISCSYIFERRPQVYGDSTWYTLSSSIDMYNSRKLLWCLAFTKIRSKDISKDSIDCFHDDKFRWLYNIKTRT